LGDVGQQVVVERDHFDELLGALRDSGYALVGPTVRDEAIVYDEMSGAEDLPVGWTDVQEAGRYRLERRGDQALFGYTVGPHSWKKSLHQPRVRLWGARRNGNGNGFEVSDGPEDGPKLAMIGVRSCELHAIAIQDRVLLGGEHADPHYAARRKDIFVIAVNCGQAGNTCFCVSMNTGPRATSGYDLALTELIDGDRHAFLVEIGSEAGAEMMGKVTSQPASDEHLAAGEAAVARAAEGMGRTMDADDVKDLLARNLENRRWDDVAQRCLACANCTMVCPTCFCTTVEDVTDLTGEHAERWRTWDSCFTTQFSYIHGGSVRPTISARYRQWLTHKLSSWHDQFDTSGCVGCGRCITWCPVGIDLTEEVKAIRASEDGAKRKH